MSSDYWLDTPRTRLVREAISAISRKFRFPLVGRWAYLVDLVEYSTTSDDFVPIPIFDSSRSPFVDPALASSPITHTDVSGVVSSFLAPIPSSLPSRPPTPGRFLQQPEKAPALDALPADSSPMGVNSSIPSLAYSDVGYVVV